MQRYYGEDAVEIVAAGQQISWRVTFDRVPGETKKRPRRKVDHAGEEYRARCKLCMDHRARLYVNHRWGVWDEETGSKNMWMVQCFNEQCYSDYEAQAQLYERLFALPRGAKKPMRILPGRQVNPGELEEGRPPGITWRIDELAKSHPNHPAVAYLEGRGCDVDKLGRLWGVSYCPRSIYNNAENRIIAPIFMRKMLVGWQARYIGDDVNGVPFNEAGVPKWWTMPGLKRRLVAYNIERAIKHQTIVVVEGPSDSWNVGLMATGCLGKTMSTIVQKILVNGVRKHHPHDGIVIVALDPKQDEKDIKRNKPHPINKLVADLTYPLQGRVVPLWLPEEYDPGSMDRQWFRELCREAAAKYLLKASFKRP